MDLKTARAAPRRNSPLQHAAEQVRKSPQANDKRGKVMDLESMFKDMQASNAGNIKQLVASTSDTTRLKKLSDDLSTMSQEATLQELLSSQLSDARLNASSARTEQGIAEDQRRSADLLDNIIAPIESAQLLELSKQTEYAKKTLDASTQLYELFQSNMMTQAEQTQRKRTDGPVNPLDLSRGFAELSDKTDDTTDATKSLSRWFGKVVEDLRLFSRKLTEMRTGESKAPWDLRDVGGIVGTIASIVIIFKELGKHISGMAEALGKGGGFLKFFKFLGWFTVILEYFSIPDPFGWGLGGPSALMETLGLLGETFGSLFKFAGSLVELFLKVMGVLSPIFWLVGALLVETFNEALRFLKAMLDGATVFVEAINWMLDWVLRFYMDIATGKIDIGKTLTDMWTGFLNSWMYMGAYIQQVETDAWNWASGLTGEIVNAIWSGFVATWVWLSEGTMKIVTDSYNWAAGMIKTAIDGIWAGLVASWVWLTETVPQAISDTLAFVYQSFLDTMGAVWDQIVSGFSGGLFQWLGDVMVGLIFPGGMNNIVGQWVTDMFTKLSTWWTGLPDQIGTAISNLIKDDPLGKAVAGLVEGLFGWIPTAEEIGKMFQDMILNSPLVPDFVKDWMRGEMAKEVAAASHGTLTTSDSAAKFIDDMLKRRENLEANKDKSQLFNSTNVQSSDVKTTPSLSDGAALIVMTTPTLQTPKQSMGAGFGGIGQGGFSVGTQPFTSQFDDKAFGISSPINKMGF